MNEFFYLKEKYGFIFFSVCLDFFFFLIFNESTNLNICDIMAITVRAYVRFFRKRAKKVKKSKIFENLGKNVQNLKIF